MSKGLVIQVGLNLEPSICVLFKSDVTSGAYYSGTGGWRQVGPGGVPVSPSS